jgi:succinyl-diaminopimelate desuccinylase
MVNKKRLIQLTKELISINSENPPGREQAIAEFVEKYFKKLGLKVKTYVFKPGRSNILATLEGVSNKRSLLITPHLDTVPSGKNWHYNPFKATIRGNRIYGLGASDCKGNLACAMEVINSLVETRAVLSYNLIIAATADEESGSTYGLLPLLNKGILKPDAAVVLDSSDFDIIVSQKGLIHLKVKIEGKRAHGAYTWLGVNAINIAIDILKEVRDYRFAYKRNKYLKGPTVNIGTVVGGDKVNVVADWCEFELDFRFLPGMSDRVILRDLKNIIRKHAKKFTLEIEGIQEPYEINKKHSLVSLLSAAMIKNKIKPWIRGSEGATVITFFQDKGIPAIATGFGSENCAHISDEYAHINDLYKGTQVLQDFLKSYSF